MNTITAPRVLFLACFFPLFASAQKEMIAVSHLPEGFVYYSTTQDPYIPTIDTWSSWHLLSGKKRQGSQEEAQKLFPTFLQRHPDRSYRIKDKYYQKLASLRDVALAYDDKFKTFLITAEGSTFKKGESMDALTEVLKAENKAEQNFIFSALSSTNKFYFIRNGGLCAINATKDAVIEDIIKPIAGLRITNFKLSWTGKYAIIELLPANIKWTKWSSAYNDLLYRVFDLSTGKPFMGIKIEDFYGAIFSHDDKHLLNWSWRTGQHHGALYNLEKNEKVRDYGPALYQRVKGWWHSYTDGRYLYNVPSIYNNVVRVYDLLDSLYPVVQFTSRGSNTSEPKLLKPVKVNPTDDPLSYFPDLPSSFDINGFQRPIPGTLLPPSLWNRLDIFIDRTNFYFYTTPNLQDSAAGRFRVYAIGTVAKNENEQLLLIATQLIKDRDIAWSDNENLNLIEYHLCLYDRYKAKVTRKYLLLLDGRIKLDPFEPPVIGLATISLKEETIYISSSAQGSLQFDKKTLKLK